MIIDDLSNNITNNEKNNKNINSGYLGSTIPCTRNVFCNSTVWISLFFIWDFLWKNIYAPVSIFKKENFV